MTTPRPLSAAEAAVVGRFEAAPWDEASAVERVARALWAAEWRDEVTVIDWRASLDDDDRDFYRRLTHAALAEMAGPPVEPPVVAAMRELAEELEAEADQLAALRSWGALVEQGVKRETAERIRAVLGAQGGES